MLISVGENPVYDVRARIVPDPHRRLLPVNGMATYEVLEEVMTVNRWLDVGTLNPSNLQDTGYPSLLIPFDLGDTETRRAYNVFFTARHDQFMQYLRFVRVGAQWFVAYRVVRQLGGDEGPVLREFVQEGYPLNAAGQVDWQWEREEATR